MDVVSRGVLKQEICWSLSEIFLNLAKESGAENADPKLWKILTSIFNVAKKWSKKDKLRVPCLRLMSSMAALGTGQFLLDKGEEILTGLLNGLKVFSNPHFWPFFFFFSVFSVFSFFFFFSFAGISYHTFFPFFSRCLFRK
jgi:hypothetical protein